MHGGVVPYRGSPAGARNYVEAGRSRADDYYLADGNGAAERYAASPDTGVRRLASLTGDQYEAWVAGVDPDTGTPKGRLRNDDNAVRFVEVTVNGPKSWSLAAALHPDISAAYDAAQDAAAEQIIAWLAEHATTRVGPRGAQFQVPITELQAVTVRHRTSRAGDPHRHLHLQINARVLAEGRWRGLHTVGVRDSSDAINGIGHAAVMTDPGFRHALAAHGFTLDPESAEVVQLADFVGPFSARAAQIGRNVDRYEAVWRAANPGRQPGPALRRAWDARAWADGRPDKVVPRDGAELTRRWVAALHELGYRDAGTSHRLTPKNVGAIDRDAAVDEVLSRLAARHSAWNAADVRGEIEQLIARRNVVTEPAVRTELAEDMTARTLDRCVPLLDRLGVPEHIRALTSRRVIDVESDLSERLGNRGNVPADTVAPPTGYPDDGLDARQHDAVAALGGDHQLVVVEGAAGVGKTTTLAAARTQLAGQGHRLVIVTPTLKAARVAERETAGAASSSAWLIHQHGYRWADDGSWARLTPGQTDPSTGATFTGPSPTGSINARDLLLVDEAGMLDQDTAQALLTIADERGARVAFVGDRHQLPAVGRGGVLDLAVRSAAPEARLTLDTVHRFTRVTVDSAGYETREPDADYAQLSLAMRTGDDPGHVFDALLARGQIEIHGSEGVRTQALAAAAVHGNRIGEPSAATLAETREAVATLNAHIRDVMVSSGQVDDTAATTTDGGQRIGVGDHIATRRNDHHLRVANRDTWTVTHLADDSRLTVAGVHGVRTLPADYVRAHVELAYATTVYGAQGETVTRADMLVGAHSSASSVYVGMTRGREANVAHLVADSVDDAREQWVGTFARDRADLGPAHATELAAQEASRYAVLRPVDVVLDQLRRAWTAEQDATDRLTDATERRDLLRGVTACVTEREATMPALRHAYSDALIAATSAETHAGALASTVHSEAGEIAANLRHDWELQRPAAYAAAATVYAGSGRLGQHRHAVREATEHLARWSVTWQPYLPDMPTRTADVTAFADRYDNAPRIHDAFDSYAQDAVERAHPELATARQATGEAVARRADAWTTLRTAAGHYDSWLAHYGALGNVNDPAGRLAEAENQVVALHGRVVTAREQVATVVAEPTVRALAPGRVDQERDQWRVDRQARADARLSELMMRGHTERERRPRYEAIEPHPAPAVTRPAARGRGR